jgi:hypothetical protein
VLIAWGSVDILPPVAFWLSQGDYACAWFIWKRDHIGDPTIQWFTPEGDGDR